MMTMNDIEKKLRIAGRKQASLYLFCNFIALMLITAYSAMMLSPTVLEILPEGGDSRKQMAAIFVLACFGCVIFTIYGARLYYKNKSKELGTMMALGATRKSLRKYVLMNTLSLSSLSSLLGIVCGIPFAWIIWQLFRLFIVDSSEMKLTFDLKALFISAAFFVLVVLSAYVMGLKCLKRTNIMDVVHEEHKNEPVHEMGRWVGPVGIVVLLAGAVLGYFVPGAYMKAMQAYPPAWLNILYAPVFIGLYMIILHTVLHGWSSHKKHPYKGIIARNMMKFQGKQTVSSMLVVTVLIAGAAFGIFYVPTMATAQTIEVNSRPYEYEFDYRLDQNLPGYNQIQDMASKYGLDIKDWKTANYSSIAMDGEQEIDDEGGKYHYEYRKLLQEVRMISTSQFNHLSGQNINVPRGSYKAVTTEGNDTDYVNQDGAVLTNMITKETLKTSFGGCVHDNMLAAASDHGYYVLNDKDFTEISAGLTDYWKGRTMLFNVTGQDSYAFANMLFNTIVDSFDKSCETDSYFDRVSQISAHQRGETYWADTIDDGVSYDKRNSPDFRMSWTYMPKFQILDMNDFMRSFAVYLMMFLFIAIVCMTAALVICYTRCMTITLNNRYIFEDIKRLGASPSYLKKEVKQQCSKIYTIPAIVGMAMMYLLYTMIMYGNDGSISLQEVISLAVCLGVLILMALIIYVSYRFAYRSMKRTLDIG